MCRVTVHRIHKAKDTQKLMVLMYMRAYRTLASFPGLPQGEGRPGTHCLRMREFYECARHEKLWVCLRKRPKTHSCRL